MLQVLSWSGRAERTQNSFLVPEASLRLELYALDCFSETFLSTFDDEAFILLELLSLSFIVE